MMLILQMKKWRSREAQQHVRDHKVRRQQSWD